jgi:hypothetical protein
MSPLLVVPPLGARVRVVDAHARSFASSRVEIRPVALGTEGIVVSAHRSLSVPGWLSLTLADAPDEILIGVHVEVITAPEAA